MKPVGRIYDGGTGLSAGQAHKAAQQATVAAEPCHHERPRHHAGEEVDKNPARIIRGPHSARLPPPLRKSHLPLVYDAG